MSSDNNGKIMLGELKGQVEQICNRIDKIEAKIDHLQHQITQLSNFNAKIIGAAMAVATLISIIINYIR